MSLSLTVEKLHPGGEMNATDRIQYATKRIKELELLIHHWEKHEREKEKQVHKA